VSGLFAFKLMLVICTSILHLDCAMVNTVFFLAHKSDFHKHFIWVNCSTMCTQCKFALGNLPQMEIVHLNIITTVLNVLHKLLNFETWWSSLHKNDNTFLHDWKNSDANNRGKNECANWIGKSGLWVKVNNSGSNANSN